MAILHPTKGGHMSAKGHAQSSKMMTEAGSGSRPTMSKHKIETSSPMHHHHLDRKPPSPLK